MSRGRQRNQFKCITIVRALQHVEGLAKAQVSQNVHGQIIAPVGHVLGYCPALALIRRTEADLFAKGAHIGQNVTLHLLHGAVAEAMAKHTPLAGMQGLVPGVVRVGRRVHKCVVELGLAHVGLEAVNFLESSVGVEGDAVGSETHDPSVSLVLAPKLQVPVTLPGVVELVGVSDSGQERSRILGERVEVEAIDYECNDLPFLVSHVTTRGGGEF